LKRQQAKAKVLEVSTNGLDSAQAKLRGFLHTVPICRLVENENVGNGHELNTDRHTSQLSCGETATDLASTFLVADGFKAQAINDAFNEGHAIIFSWAVELGRVL
jgi:hypothetical protein